jgi:hypothetical protein
VSVPIRNLLSERADLFFFQKCCGPYHDHIRKGMEMSSISHGIWLDGRDMPKLGGMPSPMPATQACVIVCLEALQVLKCPPSAQISSI